MIGSIEGLCGPMFSEKTTELLRRLRRHEIAGRSSLLFKPDIDNRYGSVTDVVTHDGARRSAIAVPAGLSGVGQLYEQAMASDVSVIGIDEAQFFHPDIYAAAIALRDEGRIVIWSGLDMDSNGTPFGAVPMLMAVGGVTKLTAVCFVCGADATHTHRRRGQGGGQLLVGASDRYAAMCLPHWRENWSDGSAP